jgi:hypothetical protein
MVGHPQIPELVNAHYQQKPDILVFGFDGRVQLGGDDGLEGGKMPETAEHQFLSERMSFPAGQDLVCGTPSGDDTP